MVPVCAYISIWAYAHAEEGQEVLWANSAGVLAHAHIDLEENINLQLRGEKKWTLWAPHQLDDMCFYPYPLTSVTTTSSANPYLGTNRALH